MAAGDVKIVSQLNETAKLLSLDYFLRQTVTLTKKKGYSALQQALIDYHHASTFPQLSKQVELLDGGLAGMIGRCPKERVGYLQRLRNQLDNVRRTIRYYAAKPIKRLPSLLHFICIGRPLTQTQQQQLVDLPPICWTHRRETKRITLLLFGIIR